MKLIEPALIQLLKIDKQWIKIDIDIKAYTEEQHTSLLGLVLKEHSRDLA